MKYYRIILHFPQTEEERARGEEAKNLPIMGKYISFDTAAKAASQFLDQNHKSAMHEYQIHLYNDSVKVMVFEYQQATQNWKAKTDEESNQRKILDLLEQACKELSIDIQEPHPKGMTNKNKFLSKYGKPMQFLSKEDVDRIKTKFLK